MRALLPIVLLAACGRVSFQPIDRIGATTDGGLDDAEPDPMLAVGLRLWMELEPTAPSADTITGLDAACSSCGTDVAGPRGRARMFNGTSDCFTLWDNPAFAAPEFTLALWLRFNGTSSASAFGKASDGAGSNWNSWEVWVRNNALQVEFQTSANNTYNEDVIVGLQRDVWTHVTATFTATDKVVYFDGVEKGREDPTDPLLIAVDPVRVGCDEDSGTLGQFFAGAIDDVRFYDRVLPLVEIQALAAP